MRVVGLIMPSVAPISVMAGLGPAIHDFFFPVVKSWMPGLKPAPGPAGPDPGGRA